MLDLGRGILLMNSQDKLLYHQIHPIKLIVDVGGTPPALYLLWQHKLRAGLVLSFAPPLLVSALLIRYADLNPYQRSALGKFMHTYKRPSCKPSGWQHQISLILFGFLIVLMAWARGLLWPKR